MLKIKFRFDGRHRDTSASTPPWTLRALFVNLTEACNQSCAYCHAETSAPRRHLPLALVERILDGAQAMGRPAVVLTGGEPLLYPRLDDVLTGCQRRELPCKIATNGTQLTASTVQRLVDRGVRSVQISLDTCDPAHYAAWRGSSTQTHADVLAGIERCCQQPALHTVVSAVATPATRSDLGPLLHRCGELGAATFTLYHLIPYGRARGHSDAWLSESAFVDTCDELLTQFATLPRHVAVDLGLPWAAGSDLLARWRDRLDIRPVGCIAGKTSMTVLVDGHAVPCVCLEDLHFSCGNLHEAGLEELWNAPVMRLFRGETPIPGCHGCTHLDACLGGCRALAYLHHGQANAPDPACASWGCRHPAGAARSTGS